MSIKKEGDLGKAICSKCGITNTTYMLRNIPFNDNRGIVEGLLVGVCNCCNEVISIPPQYVQLIKKEFENIVDIVK